MTEMTSNPNLIVEQKPPGVLLVRLSGNCREQDESPSLKVVRDALEQTPGVTSLMFKSAAATG